MNLCFNSISIFLLIILNFFSINEINSKEFKTFSYLSSEAKKIDSNEENFLFNHNDGFELNGPEYLQNSFKYKSKKNNEGYLKVRSKILSKNLNLIESKSSKKNSIDQKTINNNDDIFLPIEKYQYLLGPGDKIKILFYEPEILTSVFEIMANGYAVIPNIGSIKLNNLTLQSAKEKINFKMKDLVIEPIFDLIIQEPRPIRVTIIGESNNPGVYTLPFKIDNYNYIEGNKSKNEVQKYQPTIIDALQISGGINLNSNLQEIELVRRFSKENKIVNRSIFINLSDLFLKGNLENNVLLYDGDIVKIKKTINQIDDDFKIINANLTPKTHPIYVVGEVKFPGQINVPINSSLIDSILMAGGPLNSRASKSNVRIIRAKDNGSISRKNFKVSYSKNENKNTNPIVKKNDIIFVQSTSIARFADTIDTVTAPIRNTLSIYALFKLIEN